MQLALRAVAVATVSAFPLAFLFLATTDHAAWSQSHTIRIVVPYPPGSGPDILSRLMGEQFGAMNAPNIVVENRAGGGTLIGTEAVARAAPDGNTLLLVANTYVITQILKPQT